MTSAWYRAVLEKLAAGSRVLDVGIGTGRALLANAALVRERNLTIHGIDIDTSYIEACRAAIKSADLRTHVSAEVESVYDHNGGPYDAIYFSASFMLLPDAAAALRHLTPQLTDEGAFYFTQTFQDRRSAFAERIKPLLRYLTTIDFGNVTYRNDFGVTLEQAGVSVISEETLSSGQGRSERMIVARPE